MFHGVIHKIILAQFFETRRSFAEKQVFMHRYFLTVCTTYVQETIYMLGSDTKTFGNFESTADHETTRPTGAIQNLGESVTNHFPSLVVLYKNLSINF